jgi:4-amino-4-deoxy-L-arabinose transferase-like glycosyltransferase
MVYVSPIIELLRARPAVVFWTAAFAQALLWTLVPAAFYASPPGDVPLVLAIGHEWPLGTWLGPPLAFWLAEIAFRAAGNSVLGIYLLSQICVAVALWALFALGRAIVGAKHAAIAVLLMAGCAMCSVPTAEFGPGVLAMPLVALALLYLWRAMAQARPRSWLALGVILGLLVLTTHSSVALILLIAAFTVVTRRGRQALRSPYPWMALVITAAISSPYLWWVYDAGALALPVVPSGALAKAVLLNWPWLVVGALLAHAGLVVLIIASGAAFARPGEGPVITREPVGRFGKAFVYVFALVLALLATLAMALGLSSAIATGVAPFVVLSGLAIVLAAGDVISIRRQTIAGWIWLALLIGPALLTIAAMAVLPVIFGIDMRVREPASAMGQFFTETFNRRTGRPLAIVGGDLRFAGLVALASTDRPRLLVDAATPKGAWISDQEIAEKGAVIVWPITDQSGQPPETIRGRFPDLVPEVPHAFQRLLQGTLLRVGWAVIRPANAPSGWQ